MTRKNFVAGMENLIPKVNDSPYKRILAIGDVHAAFDKLISLWEKISVKDDDLVIFLGDYFYVPESKNVETLQWILEHYQKKNLIFLRGNTDDEFLNYYYYSLKFIINNPDRCESALKEIEYNIDGFSQAVQTDIDFPKKFFDFLDNIPNYYFIEVGGKKFFFCHAGVNPKCSLDEQKKIQLIGYEDEENFYRNYFGDALIVVGHKSPKKIFEKFPEVFPDGTENISKFLPLKIPQKNILMLDTRARESKGFLTCVDVLTGEFWQS